MLRSVKDMLGFTVRGIDEEVGSVTDLYFDDDTWDVRYLVVATGTWLLGREVLIAPAELEPVNWEEQVLPVRLTQEQVEESPSIDLQRPVSRQDLEELHSYYGWPAFWTSSVAPLSGGPRGAYPYVGPRATLIENDPGIPDELVRGERDQWSPFLHSAKEVVDYRIHAEDGEIGHVEDFFVDDEEWVVRYSLVDTRNWLPGRRVLVAPVWIERIDWHEQEVYVGLTRECIKNGPEYDPSVPISRNYEAELYEHCDTPGYWE